MALSRAVLVLRRGRPDLTGRGLGQGFVEAGVEYAASALGATRFALAVAAFNRRAITVYERAGFREVRRYRHETNGGSHEFVWMVRPLRPPARAAPGTGRP